MVMMFLRPHIGASLNSRNAAPLTFVSGIAGSSCHFLWPSILAFDLDVVAVQFSSCLPCSRLRTQPDSHCRFAGPTNLRSVVLPDEPRYWQNYQSLYTYTHRTTEPAGIPTGWVYCETSAVSGVQSANASKVQLERRLSGLRQRRSPVM